jgi:hypothetical protein
MKASDIISLGEGVFKLEEGCCDWLVSHSDMARILYGGIHTELGAMSAKEDEVL